MGLQVREFLRRVITAAAPLLLAACATAVDRSNVDGEPAISPYDILNSSPLAGSQSPSELEVDMLGVTPEMIAFLDRNVDRDASQRVRLVQLLTTVIGEQFLLDYDTTTLTAKEAFEKRRGNCLSFTNMFVAMARELELPADFQEVEIPPDWSMSGETFLLSRHINAVVEVSNSPKRVVDFNAYTFNAYNEGDIIGDSRALAHYFNNIGVEHMLKGDTGQAFVHFRQSLRDDRTFDPAWVNLGILHRREGYTDYAEAAWFEALRWDRNNLLAMSNLANLYHEQGKIELAEYYLKKVRTHRLKNPYFHYRLASEAFDEGDYDAAIDHLEVAIRKREGEDRFYYLMSMSWLMKGNGEKARRWMQEAENAARQSKDRQRYHHKLQLLSGNTDAGLKPGESTQ
jgi:Flp pilus assembly protein TadD